MKIFSLFFIISLGFTETVLLRNSFFEEKSLKQLTAAIRAETADITKKSNALQQTLDGLLYDLNTNIAPQSEQIQWSYHWVQNAVKTVNIAHETQYRGVQTPLFLKLTKASRDSGCYRSIALTAYEIEIQTKTSLPKLLLLAEAIEKPSSPAFVSKLYIAPINEQNGLEEIYDIRMRIRIPSFLYNEEMTMIRQIIEPHLPLVANHWREEENV